MPNQPLIELTNVSVRYDSEVVLENINLTLKGNIFLGVIGPNGGGKTTLLRLLLGLLHPSSGGIKVMGKSPKQACRFIGYVPQKSSFHRDFPISVMDVVLMGRITERGFLSAYDKTDKEKAIEALRIVHLADLQDRRIGELSEGQRQRVFIARALAREPKLLLLDEPTSSIDSPMQAGLYEVLSRLKKQLSIILVSHDIGVIGRHVDKIACLNKHLYYHDSKEISREALEAAYQCPIDLIGHGVPHRVVEEHKSHD